MKQTFKIKLLSFSLVCGLLLPFGEAGRGFSQNVGINATGAAPNISALLDLDATNKGLLVPRVALTITTSNSPIGASVATSLLIYNTATVNDVSPGYYYWDGSKWVNMSGDGWKLTGNTGTNDAINFIGTTDAQDFVIKVNNIERARINTGGKLSIGNFSNPEEEIEIRTSYAGINIRSYNNSVPGSNGFGGSKLVIQRHRGSLGGGLPVQNGDALGELDFRGGNGSSTISGITSALIASFAKSNWTTSSRAADLRFYAINTITSNNVFDYERLRITENGVKWFMRGGLAIGDNSAAISTVHGTRNSIQINTDTQYGGVNDEHSGVLIYSTMPGGWTTAKLDICISDNWGTYNTASPALRIEQTQVTMHGVAITSDRRLKTNIGKLNYGLKDLMKITPVSYVKHIATEIKKGKVVLEEKGVKRIGFIAQDLYQIIPEVVNKPENEDEEFWSVDYSKMSAVMVKAIQELNNKIELLERELAEMKDSKNSGN